MIRRSTIRIAIYIGLLLFISSPLDALNDQNDDLEDKNGDLESLI